MEPAVSLTTRDPTPSSTKGGSTNPGLFGRWASEPRMSERPAAPWQAVSVVPTAAWANNEMWLDRAHEQPGGARGCDSPRHRDRRTSAPSGSRGTDPGRTAE